MGLFGGRGGSENAAMLREFKGLAAAKKYRGALEAGRRYLERVPHNHDVLFTMGGIHYVGGRYRDALSYLDRALEIGSYDTEALILKAYSHERLGEPAEASACCEKIREVDPGNAAAAELLGRLDLE
ncbi:TPR repeat-containing protein [Nitrosopumilaceae archaeon]|nr:tetratricopeptide repeat protein [Nitrosopumilus sp.]CAI9832303.1 TPR repeat-containing protein [Nitrosopumilaceae archaeon]MDA7945633.1 tetratricopeptide repeat protein [Nitrosopumilus sp.]MDA7954874.1 tetratricopeptide repeat protein [Nitrosopumilus sp.]MDA7960442.1 tetratricopeptide repeat protein [Nitrosopumilus sp.]